MSDLHPPGLAIRRLSAHHAAAIRDLYLSLSETSRALRFGSPMPRLAPRTLARLCTVDGEAHAAVGAWLGDRLVGVGHRVRSPRTGEHDVALAVADEVQCQGIGGRLLDSVAREACRAGIRRLTFHLSGENRRMARILARRGVRVRWSRGCGEGTWELPAWPTGDGLRPQAGALGTGPAPVRDPAAGPGAEPEGRRCGVPGAAHRPRAPWSGIRRPCPTPPASPAA